MLTAAYAVHPERFVAGVPRPPTRPTEVWINPPPATAMSTPNPAPAGCEEDPDAFWSPVQPRSGVGTTRPTHRNSTPFEHAAPNRDRK